MSKGDRFQYGNELHCAQFLFLAIISRIRPEVPHDFFLGISTVICHEIPSVIPQRIIPRIHPDITSEIALRM